MKKYIKLFFKYIEPIWLGENNKVALKSVLAITFSVNFISNLHHAIYKWDVGKSLSDLSTVLMIEAGLIAGLVGIKAISDWAHHKIDSDADNPQEPDNTIKINNVEQINTETKA